MQLTALNQMAQRGNSLRTELSINNCWLPERLDMLYCDIIMIIL